MDVTDPRAEAERALYEERAAIREHLGGLPRAAAEEAARADARRWLAHEAQLALDARPGWRARTSGPREQRAQPVTPLLEPDSPGGQ